MFLYRKSVIHTTFNLSTTKTSKNNDYLEFFLEKFSYV